MFSIGIALTGLAARGRYVTQNPGGGEAFAYTHLFTPAASPTDSFTNQKTFTISVGPATTLNKVIVFSFGSIVTSTATLSAKIHVPTVAADPTGTTCNIYAVATGTAAYDGFGTCLIGNAINGTAELRLSVVGGSNLCKKAAVIGGYIPGANPVPTDSVNNARAFVNLTDRPFTGITIPNGRIGVVRYVGQNPTTTSDPVWTGATGHGYVEHASELVLAHATQTATAQMSITNQTNSTGGFGEIVIAPAS